MRREAKKKKRKMRAQGVGDNEMRPRKGSKEDAERRDRSVSSSLYAYDDSGR